MILWIYNRETGAVVFRQVLNQYGIEQSLPKALIDAADSWDAKQFGTLLIDESGKKGTHVVRFDDGDLRLLPGDAISDDNFVTMLARAKHETRRRLTNWASQTSAPVSLSICAEADVRDVSVIITCHNYEEYLVECVQSLTNTKIPPREIIVVHDACDELPGAHQSVLSTFHPNLRVVETDFGNSALARNYGASLASGSLLLFFDADDAVEPEFLSILATAFNDPRVAISYPTVQMFGAKTDRRSAMPFDRDALWEGNYIPVAAIVRADVFCATGGFDSNLPCYRDWDLWLRIVQQGWLASARPDAVLRYRKHPGQLSEQHNEKAYGMVIQKNARVCIVSAFDDKAYCLTEHLHSILAFGLDPSHIEISLIDNSHSKDIRHELIQYHALFADKYAAAEIVNRNGLPVLDRTAQQYSKDVSRRMVDLYWDIPWRTSAEFSLVYENDVCAPGDTVTKLLEAMSQRIGAVCAAVNARPQDGSASSPGLQAWQYKSHVPPRIDFTDRVVINSDEPMSIGTSAFSCVLIRNSAWRKTRLRAAPPIWAFDGTFGHDLWQLGYKYLLHPGVHCRHMIAEGRYV